MAARSWTGNLSSISALCMKKLYGGGGRMRERLAFNEG
jgi:hypothetical protein